ncbi:GNAT family N-acetyltransferase [Xaviernesmea oryzae]|uniref:GNAT family N-acetyltransferase n=1 Tax=Xaviernesmea oryzae TaxID=464029 RepID=A0A1Q9AWX7_9HYPH|nr:GNAT family N-acetyltransferase [Xaviernesmea oryzae]OLP59951.1 GNAT family N-acetyltransferase [Xaviernesmea oryzae]SEK43405.1 Protein N-acetyltransferase, RimJ/RimL family [Xaviernesmea oryzae]
MQSMPDIMTDRLILRPHRRDDYDVFCDLWAHPDVVRHIGGKRFTAEESWMRLMNRPGMWHFMGFGFLAIEERATGRFVGEGGFHEVRRDMTPSLIGTLEMGWALLPAFHGKGYPFEAMKAMIDWADKTFPGRTMTAIIAPDNAPSFKLASKLGFLEYARTDYHGEVVVLRREVAQDAA